MSHQPTDEPSRRDRPWWMSPLWIASAAFLALVLLASGVLFGLTMGRQSATTSPAPTVTSSTPGGGSPTPTNSAPSTSTAPTSGASSPAGGACPQAKPHATGAPLTAAPKDTRWQIIDNGAAVPSTPTAGPAKIEGKVARCYAPTAEGALLAMANIHMRAHGESIEPILNSQFDPQLPSAQSKLRIETTKVSSQISAFRFVKGIENDEVRIWVEVSMPADGKITRAAAEAVMRWNGQDWVMRGDHTSTIDKDPTGFIPWKAL